MGSSGDSVSGDCLDQDRGEKRGIGIGEMVEFIFILVVYEKLVGHHLERSNTQLKT